MSINLNLRAPAANPLTFQQVDSNFNQLKTAIETIQNSLQNLSNVNHNHNDLYYLKTEVNQLLADNRWNTIYDGHKAGTSFNVGILGGVKFGWGWGNIPPNGLSNAGIRYSFPKAYEQFGPIVLAQVTSGTNQHGFIGFLMVSNIDRFGFNINVENSAAALAALGDNSRNIHSNVSFQFFCFAGW